MMERYYRLAGVELAIHMDENLMYEDERTLAPFAVEAPGRECALAEAEVPDLGCAMGEPAVPDRGCALAEVPDLGCAMGEPVVPNPGCAQPGPLSRCDAEEIHRFCFEVVEELDPPRGICVTTQPDFIVWQDGDTEIRYINLTRKVWEEAGIRAEHCGRTHRIQLKAERYPSGVGVKTVLNSLAAERLIARNGGFIFHSSYIVHRGRGILFTAPSGTGKSTQAELWRSLRGAEIINGDRSVVRVVENVGERSHVAVADGIPFAGSSQICRNVTVPLAAIVYLGQAPRTTVRRLRGFEAFRSVWEGVSVNTWDETDVALVSETVRRVIESVPVFRLDCTPDESAVLALEGILPK